MSKIIKIDPEKPNMDKIKYACDIISRGGLVILPTETVYGIACNPQNAAAMKRLQDSKGRDPKKPISRLASSLKQVKDICLDWNDGLDALCSHYWPGPLTLVLQTDKEWIGFRIPNHKVPISLCEYYGGLLALSSANISGDSDSITAQEASSISADLIIDSGMSSKKAIPSSVIKVNKNKIEFLREGFVPFSEIQRCFQSGGNQ